MQAMTCNGSYRHCVLAQLQSRPALIASFVSFTTWERGRRTDARGSGGAGIAERVTAISTEPALSRGHPFGPSSRKKRPSVAASRPHDRAREIVRLGRRGIGDYCGTIPFHPDPNSERGRGRLGWYGPTGTGAGGHDDRRGCEPYTRDWYAGNSQTRVECRVDAHVLPSEEKCRPRIVATLRGSGT